MNKKAFSLVELMIVVAIIGVLTAIAIPNFQSFQARSRQSEAKAALTSIYTAEQAFHSQWEVYAAPFAAIGYKPSGDYRYVAGWDADLANGDKFCALASGGALTTADGTDVKLGCGPAPGRVYTGIQATTTKQFNSETYCDAQSECTYIGKQAVDAALDTAEGGPTTLSVNAFKAAAVGDIKGAEATAANVADKGDAWTINQDKELKHELNQLDEQ